MYAYMHKNRLTELRVYNIGKVLFRAYENIEIADRFES